jgi:hypothetical protein
MGLGSYMLSTVFGALEFLESEQFREMLREKRDKQPLGKEGESVEQGETKVGTSVPGDRSFAEVGSPSNMHVNSMLDHLP